MWVRMRFDIRWRDLAYGLIACVRKPIREATAVKNWPDPDELLTCLSVRSGFDLLLQALDLPDNSEVLLSALTVADMPKIVRANGLKPIPVDLSSGGFRIDPDSLRRAMTPNSRVLVVAHLFGDQTPMRSIREIAKQHNLIVVEDCAQSFAGLPGPSPRQMHDPGSAVAMFSFGPIKTTTCLQGAVLRITDTETRRRMHSIQQQFPRATNIEFAKRIFRYTILKTITLRWIFGLLMLAGRLFRLPTDQLLNRSSKNFADGDLIPQLRRRPSFALLRLMKRRFELNPSGSIQRRIALGRKLDLKTGLQKRSEEDVFWVYPLVVSDPERLVNEFRNAGFDATNRSRLAIVPRGDGTEPDKISKTYEHTVFLPWYASLSDSAVRKMIEIVNNSKCHSDSGFRLQSTNPNCTEPISSAS